MKPYLGIVALLNCMTDLLLLLAANRLTGAENRWPRLLTGAVLGGLYAGACMVRGFTFLGRGLWRLGLPALVGCVTFGLSRRGLRRTGIFLVLGMALGGVAASFGRGDIRGLLLAAGLIWILCAMGFDGTAGSARMVPLEITRAGKTLRLTALVDTGNRLRDPITGEGVLVIDCAAAQALTGLTPGELEKPMEQLGRLPGSRLIPYHSVGHSGFLLAARVQDVTLNNQKRARVVAFAPGGIGGGEGYRALTGGAMV